MGASASCHADSVRIGAKVFLGGSCNPTTWRRDIAIPRLEKAGISYYNPQVEDWHESMIKYENDAKANAEVLLFVVDNVTRAIASIAEASYFIGQRRNVVLVVQHFDENTYSSTNIQKTELKDLNRGRTYLVDMALQAGMKVFETVDAAVEHICDKYCK